MSKAYWISTKFGGSVRSVSWDGNRAITLGHPMRWVLENSHGSVRLKDLKSNKDIVISAAEVEKGFVFPFEGNGSIVVRAKEQLTAAVDQVGPSSPTNVLMIYGGIGSGIASSHRLEKRFTAVLRRQSIFILRKNGDRYQIRPVVSGLSLSFLGSSQVPQVVNGVWELSEREISGATISHKLGWWKFSSVRAIRSTSETDSEILDEQTWWSRTFLSAVISAVILGAISLLPPAILTSPEPPTADRESPPQVRVVRYRAIPQQPEAATAVVAEEIIVPERIIPIPEERAPQKLDSVKSAETRVKVANPVNRRVAIPKPSAKPMQNSIDESFKNALLGALALSKKDVPAVDGGVPAPSGGRELKVNHTGGVDSPVAKLDIRTAALSIDTSKNSKEFSQGGIEHQKIAMMQGRGFEVVSVPVPDGMSVEEGLSKDEVGSVIHSHRTEVRYCYESALIHNPEISGKVVVRFVIESSGRIQSVSPEQSSLNGSEVEKCVVSHIKSWKFPKPRDGGDISVSYPFHFRLMARE